ncbi:MAG: hypothetical protein KatS3mg087_1147 [Patescibacteria group bacterium]|nr:MAG: hypothetical protein KatS3mg087_1147 [Patescibacteria group bacterium]
MNTNEIKKHIRQYEQTKEQYNKLLGAKEQLEKQLLEQFNCSNLEDAEALVADLMKQKTRLEAELQAAIEEFQRKWLQRLKN